MQAILGVLFHSIGGIAAGSFYMPYNKVKGWALETYWMVGGVISWLIVPPIAASLTVPGCVDIITASSNCIIRCFSLCFRNSYLRKSRSFKRE